MRPHLLILWFAVLSVSGIAFPARADLVVVAHPKSGIEQLTRDEVANIFLGRYRRLSSGVTAEPLDLPAASDARAVFYRQLVGKSLPEINAYWARLVFSGKTRPPEVAADADEALRLVMARPGVLAYVERKKAEKADKGVIIVFKVEE